MGKVHLIPIGGPKEEPNYIPDEYSSGNFVNCMTTEEYNAKQERMYSEEEVIYLLYSLKNYLGFGEEVKEQEWFKQFKNK